MEFRLFLSPFFIVTDVESIDLKIVNLVSLQPVPFVNLYWQKNISFLFGVTVEKLSFPLKIIEWRCLIQIPPYFLYLNIIDEIR